MARPSYRHGSDQVPTVGISISEIMHQPQFALGVSDARAGRPYRDAYQTWHVNAQWGYERGRQWATLVPSSVTLKRDGKVTAEAADWGQRVFEDIR